MGRGSPFKNLFILNKWKRYGQIFVKFIENRKIHSFLFCEKEFLYYYYISRRTYNILNFLSMGVRPKSNVIRNITNFSNISRETPFLMFEVRLFVCLGREGHAKINYEVSNSWQKLEQRKRIYANFAHWLIFTLMIDVLYATKNS